MRPLDLWRPLAGKLWHRHRDVRSFEQEVQAAGGVGAGHDVGSRIVPVDRIVGSVGRWQNLRSDFFYRTGGVTQRLIRVGDAMRKGIALPPIQVYKLRRPPVKGVLPPSEYYVVDGHHRVAMARKLGQDFLDAEVKEFKARGSATEGAAGLEEPPEHHRSDPQPDRPSPDDAWPAPGCSGPG